MDPRSATTDPAFRPANGQSFPGGKVRLPSIHDEPSSTPRIDVVETAFRRTATATIDEPEPSGFSGYYTYESLFDGPDGSEEGGIDDPYVVLNVSRDQKWVEIVSAHRALVKACHPDRFVGQPADIVARAEADMKRINLAYSAIRREHAAESRI